MATAAWVNLEPGPGEPDWMPLAREFSVSVQRFFLHVQSWADYQAPQKLTWNSVPYSSSQHPPSVRGVYAFVLDARSHALSPIPPASFVLYVGETGDNGSATLKKRLTNYRNKRAQRARVRVYRMLEQWGDSLHFYFAPVNSGVSTKECEIALLDALLPPMNKADFTARVSNAREYVLSM